MSITLPTLQMDYMTDLTHRARQLGSLGGGLGGLTGGLDRAFDPLKRVLREQLTQSVIRDKIDPFVDEVKQMAQERFDLQEQPMMTTNVSIPFRATQGGGAFASDGPQLSPMRGLGRLALAVPERMAKGGPMVSGLGSFLASNIDEFGRNGDTEMIHATREEVIMPKGMMDDPEVRETVREAFARSGRDMDEFTVGSGKMNVNPVTGYEEAFDLIGGIKDLFKKAVPVLLPAAASYFFPGMSPFLSGALASGVGSLLQGGNIKDAFQAGLTGGLTSAATTGLMKGSLSAGFQGDPTYKPFEMRKFGEAAVERPEVTLEGKMQNILGGRKSGNQAVKDLFINPSQSADEIAGGFGFDSFKEAPTEIRSVIADQVAKGGSLKVGPSIGAGLAGLYLAGGFDEIEEEAPEDPYPYTSRELLEMYPERYTTGPIVAPRRRRGRFYAAKGGSAEFPRKNGAIAGPGTGTSDDIPAMLSDGEFVMTAKAVRGAGNGSREKGVQNMYKMMRAFEGGAVT